MSSDQVIILNSILDQNMQILELNRMIVEKMVIHKNNSKKNESLEQYSDEILNELSSKIYDRHSRFGIDYNYSHGHGDLNDLLTRINSALDASRDIVDKHDGYDSE